MQSILFVLASCVFTAAGQIAFKYGMQGFDNINFTLSALPRLCLQLATTPSIIIGFASFGLGAVLWLFALARLELSYAVPLASITYVLVLLAGVYMFNEPLTAAKLIGTSLVALGVVALSWQ